MKSHRPFRALHDLKNHTSFTLFNFVQRLRPSSEGLHRARIHILSLDLIRLRPRYPLRS